MRLHVRKSRSPLPPPRPETADLARRIAAAARRNGTDPADLPAIHKQAQFIEACHRWALAFTAAGKAMAAINWAPAFSSLREFEAIGAGYAEALEARR